MKKLEERILESMRIHTQLEKLGVFVLENNRELVRMTSNKFVRDGESGTLTLARDQGSDIRVVFTNKEGIKSGILIE